MQTGYSYVLQRGNTLCLSACGWTRENSVEWCKPGTWPAKLELHRHMGLTRVVITTAERLYNGQQSCSAVTPLQDEWLTAEFISLQVFSEFPTQSSFIQALWKKGCACPFTDNYLNSKSIALFGYCRVYSYLFVWHYHLSSDGEVTLSTYQLRGWLNTNQNIRSTQGMLISIFEIFLEQLWNNVAYVVLIM